MSSIISAKTQAYAQSLLSSGIPISGQAQPLPAQFLSLSGADFSTMDPMAMPKGEEDTVYAEVIKNGRVVATVMNSGSAATASEANIPLDAEGIGPNAAKKRAEQLAEALGGTVRVADTAMTQSDWLKTDAGKQASGVLAMENQGKSAASKVEAQLQGQREAKALAQTQKPGQAAKEEFMALMQGDMADKMRALVLKELGLTEEDIANMSPEEQRKIEDLIRQRMEMKMKQTIGNSDAEGNKREAEESSLKIEMTADIQQTQIAQQQVASVANNQTADLLKLALAQQEIPSDSGKGKKLFGAA